MHIFNVQWLMKKKRTNVQKYRKKFNLLNIWLFLYNEKTTFQDVNLLIVKEI